MLKNKLDNSNYKIPSDIVLQAYKSGLFPMAETVNSQEIYWIEPKKRGVFYFDKIKVPKKLKKLSKSLPFQISVDLQFNNVIENCSKLTAKRNDTWINNTIKQIYIELYEKGYAHSVECYINKRLVGGLYGLSIGGVFFGESMFSLVSNASKFALFHLIERLKAGNYDFIDTQFINDHLSQFGAIEISNKDFKTMLNKSIKKDNSDFYKFYQKGFLPNKLLPFNYK